MNTKLLPPRPNIRQALKILGLPDNSDGFEQLLQHIRHENLPIYGHYTGYAIEAGVLNSGEINLESLEKNDVSHFEHIEVRCFPYKRFNEKDGWLSYGAFLFDDVVYFVLREAKSIDEEKRKIDIEKLKEDAIERIKQGQTRVSIRPFDLNRAGTVRKGFKNESHSTLEKFFFFYREELIAFKNGELHVQTELIPIESQQDEAPSETAIKTIGLLMELLADSPSYKNNGGEPSLNGIKDKLLDRAQALGIDSTGLAKSHDSSKNGILTKARDYLEKHRNDRQE